MFLSFKKAGIALVLALFLVPSFALAATFERPLFLGSIGSDVSALQIILKEKGLYTYPEITGYYGQITLQAVADFQKSVGLDSLGYVGPATRAILNNGAVSTSTSFTSTAGTHSSLLIELIQKLQQILRNNGYYKVELTGVLDAPTLAATQSIATGADTAPRRSGSNRNGDNDEEETVIPDATAPAISSIEISTTGTTATIRWRTNIPATSKVDYGVSLSYGTASSSSTLLTRHAIFLTGLTEETEYQYRIESADGDGNIVASENETFETTTWFDDTAMIDMDFSGTRFWYDDEQFGDTASFISAIGATTSSTTIITIEPKVTGTEVLTNPSFDTDITGWTAALANTNLSWNPAGRLLNTVPAAGNAAFSQSLSLTSGMAYQLCGETASMSSSHSSRIAVSVNQNLAAPGFGLYGETVADTSVGQQKCAYVGYGSGAAYFGARGYANNALNVAYDNFSLKEVKPLEEHNHAVLSGIIEGITPASAIGNQVVFQADANTERDRVRVVWDSSKHLRLIGTTGNLTQIGAVGGSVDFGVVEESTPFTVKFVSTTNGFKASLNNGEIFYDAVGTHPGLAFIRIGRSFTGEAWTGQIERITLFPEVLSDSILTNPEMAFVAYGDSTAFGSGSTASNQWYNILRLSYTPDRTAITKGIGGETAEQMVSRVTEDTDHRTWTTIFMDRPNTGETSTEWLENVKEAAELLETNRWLVVPPVVNSPSAGGDSSSVAIEEVQAALLTDPYFTGHTFETAQQAEYLADLSGDATRSDGVHFNNAGQAIQAEHIRSFSDSAGW